MSKILDAINSKLLDTEPKLTFDDVSTVPAASDFLPSEAILRTHLIGDIYLNMPILSAAMDRVTEHRMAIAMARRGGLGVIHKNMSLEAQVREIVLTKRADSAFVLEPVTIGLETTLRAAVERMRERNVSGLMVVSSGGILEGVLTKRDVLLQNLDWSVESRMTGKNLVVGYPDISADDAKKLMLDHRVERLPIIDQDSKLVGLATLRNILEQGDSNVKTVDENGDLRVAAAIGVGKAGLAQAEALLGAGCDVLVVDTAHGHAKSVIDTVGNLKEAFPKARIMAGNVTTAYAADELVLAGASSVKTGQGPGCFAAGTRILMADASYKNIEDIRPGDRVINMYGNPVSVWRAWCTGIRKVIGLRTTTFPTETVCTPDHKFFVGDLSSVKQTTLRNRGYVRLLKQSTRKGQSKLRWCEVGSVEQFACLLPNQMRFEIPTGFSIDLADFAIRKGKQLKRYNTRIQDGYELGYIFGMFLGDGHSFLAESRNSEMGRVSWYLGLDETDYAEKLASCLEKVVGIRPTFNPDGKVNHVHLYSLQWARIFQPFGKKDTKHLPPEYLCSNPEYLQGLFDGLVDSDGHLDNGRFCFGNTSFQLIELFNVVCLWVKGSFPNCRWEAPSAGGLEGTCDENCKESFTSRLNKTHERRRLDQFHVVKVLERNDKEIEIPVYDLETDDPSHSFIANNAIVHNSICTTRIVAGTGIPQVSAIMDCVYGAKRHKGKNATVVADGGIRTSGDLVKALVAGADCVMLGMLLAATDEAPGQLIRDGDRTYKAYRGMGSISAMQEGSKARYFQEGVASDKLVAEGVEGKVPYKGPVGRVLDQLIGGIQAGMGYVGCQTIPKLHTDAKLIRVTNAGLTESHPHDIFFNR